MGASFSYIPNTRSDNTLLPPELVERVMENLSKREKLEARLVCQDWNQFLIGSILMDEVVLKVEHTDSVLKTLLEYSLSGNWTSFAFSSLDLTRSSLDFWRTRGDFITSIEFNDCSITPHNCDTGPEFHMGCPNLKHLGLIGCNKYFMMGGNFFHLPLILDLENLESLNLSNNPYLNDYILFSLLMSTRALKSLNLSDCPISFMNAVFQRFYPGIDEQSANGFSKISENILSFQVFYKFYASTPHASNLTELIMDSTRIEGNSLKLLSDPEKFHWESLSLNRCTEIKAAQLVEFFDAQKGVKKLQIDKMKISNHELDAMDLSRIEYLGLAECTDLINLDFLQRSPKLKYLNISYCPGLRLSAGGLRQVTRLTTLKLRGIIPFFVLNSVDNQHIALLLIQVLPNLVNLTELDLGLCGTALTDDVLQLIIHFLTKLRVLRICKAKVTDLGLAGRYIDEYDPRVSARVTELRRAMVLEHMANFPEPGLCLIDLKHLRVLSLSQCLDLSEATWKLALNLPSLVSLNLSECTQLSKRGMMSIIRNCRSLEELDIHGCGAHIGGDYEIMEGIKSLPRIRNIRN